MRDGGTGRGGGLPLVLAVLIVLEVAMLSSRGCLGRGGVVVEDGGGGGEGGWLEVVTVGGVVMALMFPVK